MDIEEIEKIARKAGVWMFMYKAVAPVIMPDGSVEYISDGELTPYGRGLVAFANELEAVVMTRCNDGTTE